MKYLVLGSDGFVGKELCKHIESKGDVAVRYDIKMGREFDLRMSRLDLRGIDGVYFLAWDVGGAKFLYRDDTQVNQIVWNVEMMQNVFPQLDKSGLPFVFVSSQLAEDKNTVYGITKRLGELWSGLTHGAFVRLWNVYGSIEKETERSHVVSDLVWKAVNTGTIDLMTTGEELRQFIHIHDVCDAFELAMKIQPVNIIDVTTFEWVSVREIADTIASMTGATVVPGDKVGSTPITPIYGKMRGWNAKVSIEDGLGKMVGYAKGRAKS